MIELILCFHFQCKEDPCIVSKKDPRASNFSKIKTCIKTSKVIPDNVKHALALPFLIVRDFMPSLKFTKLVFHLGQLFLTLELFLINFPSFLCINSPPPLLCINIYTVKNSVDFVNKLRIIDHNGLTMISFDVKFLFTNVRIEVSLKCLDSTFRIPFSSL